VRDLNNDLMDDIAITWRTGVNLVSIVYGFNGIIKTPLLINGNSI
jgi:hypothetical protein